MSAQVKQTALYTAFDARRAKVKKFESARCKFQTVLNNRDVEDYTATSVKGNEDFLKAYDDAADHYEMMLKLCRELHILGEPEVEMKAGISEEYAEIRLSKKDMMKVYTHETMNTSVYQDADRSQNESLNTSGGTRHPWKKLETVNLPKFDGNKMKYPSWKARFDSVIDSREDIEDSDKLLYLRKYVTDDVASKVLDDLGHSDSAYKKALRRMERTYGGDERREMIVVHKLKEFEPLKKDDEVESLAFMVESISSNLLDIGENAENPIVYRQIMEKMTPSLLVKYQDELERKGVNKGKLKNLESFLTAEASRQVFAKETSHGLVPKKSGKKEEKKEEKKGKSFATQSQSHSSQSQTTQGRGQDRRSRANASGQQKCLYCDNEEHKIENCQTLLDKGYEECKAYVQSNGLCFRCLRRGHMGRNCQFWPPVCGINGCQRRHYKLLHDPNRVPPKAQEKLPDKPPEKVARSTHIRSTEEEDVPDVLLRLAPVPCLSLDEERDAKANSLLDEGGDLTICTESLAHHLKLAGPKGILTVHTVNGSESFPSMEVTLKVKDRKGETHDMIAHTMKQPLKGVHSWNKIKHKFSHIKDLEFPELVDTDDIDLIIGSDNAFLMKSEEDIAGGPTDPVARLTMFGWTCGGPTDDRKGHRSSLTFRCYHFSKVETEINESLKKMWEFEDTEAENTEMSPDEKKIFDATKASIKKVENGRYMVDLPWNEKKDLLKLHKADSRRHAEIRLKATEKRLKKDPVAYDHYRSIFKDWESKNFIRELTKEEDEETGWYLDHFPVIDKTRVTTPTRIVFNASAKSSKHGMSLNDAINEGPKLQKSLVKILLRFRRYKTAIANDITKMYLQIKQTPEDSKYTRFLWRDKDTDEIKVFEINRVVFGVNASPFLALLVMLKHAEDNEEKYPRAVETLQQSTYMDDSLDSIDDPDDAVKLYNELTELLSDASMSAHKWASNDASVLEQIPQEERVKQVDPCKLPSMKTLGVLWNAEDDCFTGRTNLPEIQKMTMREVLRNMSKVYDPLGFISPYILKGRMILQDVMRHGYEWDTLLSDVLIKRCEDWFEQVVHVQNLAVERCLIPEPGEEVKLHCFVDASIDGYGAVVYLQNGDMEPKLVMSKAKVAPMKTCTIPRLELCAAVLGTEIAEVVCNALELPMSAVTYWSDSLNCLYWIKGESKHFKTFVANRVTQILKRSSPEQWRHVPGKMNVADILSRGSQLDELLQMKEWWRGPGFLMDEEEWPPTVEDMELDAEAKREVKKNAQMFAIRHYKQEKMLKTEDYSSLKKLVNVKAWINRWIHNVKRTAQVDRRNGQLTGQEKEEAKLELIREEQHEYFHEEVKSLTKKKIPTSLKDLSPFLDDEERLRVGGRLALSQFPYEMKYPLILKKSPLTRLIILDVHLQLKHYAGTEHVLSELKKNYWILSARDLIKEVEKACVTCQKIKQKLAEQLMGQIPEYRLTLTFKAFSIIGFDFTAALLTKQGRGKAPAKRYILLGTCLETRAVHLEVCYSLSTDSFIQALNRVIARRGTIKVIVTDNGTNFVGAFGELEDVFREKEIEWKFNPPTGSHFGGVFESLIKSSKKAINCILQKADITDEELLSATCEAEAMLNCRPLCYQSADIKNEVCLTPNHFLTGQSGGDMAPVYDDLPILQRRWRRVQELNLHVWKRLMMELIPEWSRRRKWREEMKNLKVDDLVLVPDLGKEARQWPLGKVEKVHPGKDGLVRVVTVKRNGKLYTRPITKLVPLELN